MMFLEGAEFKFYLIFIFIMIQALSKMNSEIIPKNIFILMNQLHRLEPVWAGEAKGNIHCNSFCIIHPVEFCNAFLSTQFV